MNSARSVVGLGWLAIDVGAETSRPSGLAVDVAVHAVRLGHEARVVGRIGQDRDGDALVTHLADAGVDTSVIQRDPDLPTATRRVRADGTAAPRVDELPAAPDLLQWDFDLEDTARWADVVVFGLASWRSGQARSEELRFLDAASGAVRAADLTALTPSGAPASRVSRSLMEDALERSDVALVHPEELGRIGVRHLDDTADDDAVIEIAVGVARSHHVTLLITRPGHANELLVVDGTSSATSPLRARGSDADATPTTDPMVGALLHAALGALHDSAPDALVRAIESEHQRP